MTYKELIMGRQFEGTLFNLLGEIVEAFVNEEIGESKLGELHNIAGIVEIEDYGEFTFNECIVTGIDRELITDGILEEEMIRKNVVNVLLHKISKRSIELIDSNQIKASQAMMLESHIKAAYTLIYS